MNVKQIARGMLRVVGVGLLLATATAVAQEPIRIGAFLSVTGPAAFLGDPEQKTLEMYVERINAAGGLKIGSRKYKLELIQFDTNYQPDLALQGARKLIMEDGVK
ncbi:MAG TPA: ABC transporter substrate-binding protein, partial [Casimicrobiaceae bacterium]|nr:ABC transporter substrate-binding protein [Casimicrobiaceae bacterium]